ncbi:MAG: putative transposase [Alphaproteobacteria bacterium]|jgi:putative transposase
MSFALIDAKRSDVSVATACSVLGVSESGFYAWKNPRASPRQHRAMILLAHIRAEFSILHETYGSPRMHAELKESDLVIGRHRVARLMRENGLKARQETRFKKLPTVVMTAPLHPMFSIRTSRPTDRIKNGASISPTSGPLMAGFTWQSYWISSPDASLIGA